MFIGAETLVQGYAGVQVRGVAVLLLHDAKIAACYG
jgi:hypothetical protein